MKNNKSDLSIVNTIKCSLPETLNNKNIVQYCSYAIGAGYYIASLNVVEKANTNYTWKYIDTRIDFLRDGTKENFVFTITENEIIFYNMDILQVKDLYDIIVGNTSLDKKIMSIDGVKGIETNLIKKISRVDDISQENRIVKEGCISLGLVNPNAIFMLLSELGENAKIRCFRFNEEDWKNKNSCAIGIDFSDDRDILVEKNLVTFKKFTPDEVLAIYGKLTYFMEQNRHRWLVLFDEL